MNRSSRASLRWPTLFIVLTLGLAACSGDQTITAEKRTPIPIPGSALTVQGTPGTFGGTLAVALPEEITTFNPYYQADYSTREVLHQLYAPLIGFNPITGKTLPQEGLAESWEAVGKVVTIKMRQGLSFSDGTPIRADDVIFSLSVALDPEVKAPVADMLAVSSRLPDVTKVDDRTIQLEFPEPYPAIGYVLSRVPVICAGPDPEKTINKGRFEEVLALTTAPESIACSGPFCIGSYEKGKKIRLNYNPNYWKVDSQSLRLPYLDHIEYTFGMSNDDIVKGLQAGTVSLSCRLDPKTFTTLGESGAKYQTKDLGVGYGTWQLFGNLNASLAADKVKVSWTLDPHFREFMSRNVNREAIATNVFGGKAKPVYGLVTPANEAWYNPNIKKYPFDPTAAMSAASSGFKIVEREGKPQLVDVVDRTVKLTLYYPKGEIAEGIQKQLVEDFAKAGVPLKATAVDPGKLLTQYIVPGKFELVLWRMDGFGPDPISYMPAMMQNGTEHYYLRTPSGSSSPLEFETLVGRLMRSQQDKKLDADRQKDFNEAQKLWAEGNTVSYIVADDILIAYDKRLGNFQPVPVIPYATWNSELLFFKQ